MARLRCPRDFRGCSRFHIRAAARFFEILNGGALHPDYNLTRKRTSRYMLRAYIGRAMKKREP